MAKNKNKDTDTGQAALGLGWWVSGGLLLVIVAAIIVGVVIWPRDTNAAPDTTATATTPAATDTTDATDATDATDKPTAVAREACKATGGDQALPTEAPETVWKTHPHEWLVPTSEKYGPSKQDGNLWSCFERSPLGAVFAGPNLFAAVSAGEELAAVPGPGRDAAVESVDASSGNYERAIFEGFRVLAADENTATIDYWTTASGANASVVMELVWDEEHGDWRLNLEGGGDQPRISVIQDTSPYIRWR